MLIKEQYVPPIPQKFKKRSMEQWIKMNRVGGKKCSFKISTGKGWMKVEGVIYEGMWGIHKAEQSEDADECYALTHLRSGKKLGFYDSYEQAERMVFAIRNIIDWNKSEGEIWWISGLGRLIGRIYRYVRGFPPSMDPSGDLSSESVMKDIEEFGRKNL